MKKIVTLSILLILIISTFGCSNTNLKDNENTNSNDEKIENNLENNLEETSKSEEVDENKIIEKYNAYIEFNNFLVSVVDKKLISYYEDVSYQEEFELITKHLGTFYITNSYSRIINKAYDISNQEPKYETLDNSMKELNPILSDLIKNMNELSQYVDMKNYIDDNYEKARELHGKIYALTLQYESISEKFKTELKVLSDEKQKNDLNNFKEKELYARYYSLSVLLKAQEMEKYLNENEYVKQNILNLDLRTFKDNYYNPLNTEIEECIKYLSDVNELKKEGFEVDSNNNCNSVKCYLNALREVKASATEIIERVNNQKSISMPDFDKNSTFFFSTKEGTAEKYSKELGKLIDEYNKF